MPFSNKTIAGNAVFWVTFWYCIALGGIVCSSSSFSKVVNTKYCKEWCGVPILPCGIPCCQWRTATPGSPLWVPINMTVINYSLLSWCLHFKRLTSTSHARTLNTSRIPCTHSFDCACYYANKLSISSQPSSRLLDLIRSIEEQLRAEH